MEEVKEMERGCVGKNCGGWEEGRGGRDKINGDGMFGKEGWRLGRRKRRIKQADEIASYYN